MNINTYTTDQALLRSTAALIDFCGTNITLTREPAQTADGAGGIKRLAGASTNLAPQRVAKMGVNQITRNYVTRKKIDEEGEHRVHECVLVGMPVAAYGHAVFDVQERDTFVFKGDKFLVVSVHHDRTYEIKAFCRLTYGNG